MRMTRLQPWLGTILRNSHRMTRRAARARERRESAQLEADPTSIEKVVAARELYALIDELLGELDDEERFVIRQSPTLHRTTTVMRTHPPPSSPPTAVIDSPKILRNARHTHPVDAGRRGTVPVSSRHAGCHVPRPAPGRPLLLSAIALHQWVHALSG